MSVVNLLFLLLDGGSCIIRVTRDIQLDIRMGQALYRKLFFDSTSEISVL